MRTPEVGKVSQFEESTLPSSDEKYKKIQVYFYKKKLNRIWADETTLGAIVNDLKSNGLGVNGLCHGARNGYEVEYFRKHLNSEVIGTDISDTAKNIPNMVVWVFMTKIPNESIVLILYIRIHLTKHSIPNRFSKLGHINLTKIAVFTLNIRLNIPLELPAQWTHLEQIRW